MLYRELTNYHYRDVIQYIRDLPGYRLALSIFCSLMSYIMLTGHDVVGLRYAGYPLQYRRIAFTSFIGYSFSNTIGYSFISGGFIRYRFYSEWGLSALQIAQVITLGMITSFLGYFTVAGITFIVQAEAIPSALHIPVSTVRPIGFMFITLLTGYLICTKLVRRPLKIRGYSLQFPNTSTAFAQVIVASLDWLLAGTALYMLLPESAEIPLHGFIGIYMIAQLAGAVSQIPGGLGVFEMVMVLLLPQGVSHSQIIGTLISFRIIYYLGPFIIAALVFGVHEILDKRAAARGLAQRLGRRVSRAVPEMSSAFVFLGGIILLFSGAIPFHETRIAQLTLFLPLSVIEVSHFCGCVIGIVLIILAQGLQHRLSRAYHFSFILLGTGIIFSLLMGLRFAETVILAILFGILLLSRKQFYRKNRFAELRLTPGWYIIIGVSVLSFLWVGIFSFRHIGYSKELWWRLSLHGDVSRFLRSAIGVSIALLVFVFSRILHVHPYRPLFPTVETIEHAQRVAGSSLRAEASLALLGDKNLFFSTYMNAFIMFGIQGRSWIVLGDPVGPEIEWRELVTRFREMGTRWGGVSVFYKIDSSHLEFYRDMGYALFNFGREGKIALQDFNFNGSVNMEMQDSVQSIEKEGFVFDMIPPENVSDIITELRGISDSWLRNRSTGEKGFSTGFFTRAYITRFPQAIVKKNGRIVAFASVMAGAKKEEMCVDLIRYSRESPENVIEYIFVKIMLWGRETGFKWFNIGMVPPAALKRDPLEPVWKKAGILLFKHGEHFLDFRELKQFKEKFAPRWIPKHIALSGGLALSRVIVDVSSLISYGYRGIYTEV